MKRTFLLLFVCLALLMPLVAAPTTNSSLPSVTAVYTEDVVTLAASLRDAVNAFPLSLFTIGGGTVSPPTGLLPSIRFVPQYPLENTNHTLSVVLADAWSNNATYSFGFTVDAPVQTIRLIEPRFGGVANTTAVNVSFMTEYPSTCRWLRNDYPILVPTSFTLMNAMSSVTSANRVHTITDFYNRTGVNPSPGQAVNVSVTCDDGNKLTAKVFAIVYLPVPPTVQVTNTPNPVVDPARPYTDVTITASQDVWCTIDGDDSYFGPQLSANYRAVQTTQVSDPAMAASLAQGFFTIAVRCENRAQVSVSQDHAVPVSYNDDVVITMNSPVATNGRNYIFNFTTSKNARCDATRDGAAITLTPGSGIEAVFFRAAATNLQAGEHTFTVTCDSTFQQAPAVRSFTVIADDIPPVLSGIDTLPISCSLSELRFSFNATDPVPASGVAAYNYTIRQAGTVFVAERTASAPDITIANLNLQNGTTYTIEGFVVDAAGNPSAKRSASVRATSPAETACDREAPDTGHVTRYDNATQRTSVQIICRDEGSGCKNGYWYMAVPANRSGACTVSMTNQSQWKSPLNATQPIAERTRICYLVADQQNNIAGPEFAIVEPVGAGMNQTPTSTCSDGIKNGLESDVDCGGYVCADQEGKACAVGSACQSSADCTTRSCVNYRCTVASCFDAVKNGNESAVDCGGDCAACAGENAACSTNNDCPAGQVCRFRTCSDPPADPEDEEPAPSADEGKGWLNWLLIILGALTLLGGVGTLAFVRDEQEPVAQQDYTPSSPDTIASFEETLPQRPTRDPKAERERRRQQQARTRRRRMDRIMRTFETADDLIAKPVITHEDLEAAYEQLGHEEFAAATKKLLESKRIDEQDIHVAISDLRTKKDADADALDALKEEFNLSKQEHPEAFAALEQISQSETKKKKKQVDDESET